MPANSDFHTLEVPVQGQPSLQSINYLPFGTRTLKLRVAAEDPAALRGRKLILRSEHLPKEFGRRYFYSHEQGTAHFRVSWGGGRNRTGACLRGADMQLGNIRIPLQECREIDETASYVYLNVTHLDGSYTQPYTLHLGIHDENALMGAPPIQVIPITLSPPQQVLDRQDRTPVRFDKELGDFQGDYVPSYLGRWWSPAQIDYPLDPPPIPSIRMAAHGNVLAVDCNGTADGLSGKSKRIAEIEDHIALQGVADETRFFDAELYHFEGPYFVVRLWFSWLKEHPLRTKFDEIPDAERFDLVIDSEKGEVVYAATDSHWREVWAHTTKADKPVIGHLGLLSEIGIKNLSVYLAREKSWLAQVQEIIKTEGSTEYPRVPSQMVRNALKHPGQVSFGLGSEAHVPSLENCLPPDGLDFISTNPNQG